MMAAYRKSLHVIVLCASLLLTLSIPAAGVSKMQTANGTTVTKFKFSGITVTGYVYDATTGVSGRVEVWVDRAANTPFLDYSLSGYTSANSDSFFYEQGLGYIPSTAFDANSNGKTFHLAVTTPADFTVVRCSYGNNYNWICVNGTPTSFDLTWTKTDFYSLKQRAQETETMGPFTWKRESDATAYSAIVNGAYAGNTVIGGSAQIADSDGKTMTREYSMKTTP